MDTGDMESGHRTALDAAIAILTPAPVFARRQRAAVFANPRHSPSKKNTVSVFDAEMLLCR